MNEQATITNIRTTSVLENLNGERGAIVRILPPSHGDSTSRREALVATEGGKYEYWPLDWCSMIKY